MSACVCIKTLELIEDGATSAREKPREREENPRAVSGSVVTMLRQESRRPGHVKKSLIRSNFVKIKETCFKKQLESTEYPRVEFGKNYCSAKRKGENTTFERKKSGCRKKETKAKYHILHAMTEDRQNEV